MLTTSTFKIHPKIQLLLIVHVFTYSDVLFSPFARNYLDAGHKVLFEEKSSFLSKASQRPWKQCDYIMSYEMHSYLNHSVIYFLADCSVLLALPSGKLDGNINADKCIIVSNKIVFTEHVYTLKRKLPILLPVDVKEVHQELDGAALKEHREDNHRQSERWHVSQFRGGELSWQKILLSLTWLLRTSA